MKIALDVQTERGLWQESFARQGLPLLAACVAVLGLGPALRVARADCTRRTKVRSLAALGLTAAWAACETLRVRAAFLQFFRGDDEWIKDPAIWLPHLDNARATLEVAATRWSVAAIAFGASCCVCLWRGEPSGTSWRWCGVSAKANPLGLFNSRRWGVWARALGVVLLLAASATVVHATRPLALEAREPVPVDHVFLNCSLCIWRAPLNLGVAPDDVVEAPWLVFRGGKGEIDGSALGLDEVGVVLKNKRELWRMLNPERSREERSFTVVFDALPNLPRAQFEAVLRSARKAGYAEAHLLHSHRLELERAVLGKLVGYRSSALRIRLAHSADECGDDPSVALHGDERLSYYAGILVVLQRVRSHGQLPCIVVGAAE